MIIGVSGGRDLDPNKVCNWLMANAVMLIAARFALDHVPTIDLVIEGGAPGADRGAELWAGAASLPHRQFKANWDRYGHAAGAYRNREMLMIGRPNLFISFPSGGPGTENMITQCQHTKTPYSIINGGKERFG